MSFAPLHAQTLVWLHLADAPRDAAPYEANPGIGLVPARATRTDLAAAKAELARLERTLAGAPGSSGASNSLLDRLADPHGLLPTTELEAAHAHDRTATADADSSLLLAVSFRAPERAARIARHYGGRGDARLLPHLIALAASPAWQARRGAIEAMAELGAPDATDVLVGLLLTDPEPFNAKHAALALAKVARPPLDAVRVALEHARAHAAPMVQRAATEALSRLSS